MFKLFSRDKRPVRRQSVPTGIALWRDVDQLWTLCQQLADRVSDSDDSWQQLEADRQLLERPQPE